MLALSTKGWELHNEQNQAVWVLSTYFNNRNGNPDCYNVINKAWEKLTLGHARVWTNAPSNYYGDVHSTLAPQLFHVTLRALQEGDLNLAKTLIHESAHLLGFQHPTIYSFEDECQ